MSLETRSEWRKNDTPYLLTRVQTRDTQLHETRHNVAWDGDADNDPVERVDGVRGNQICLLRTKSGTHLVIDGMVQGKDVKNFNVLSAFQLTEMLYEEDTEIMTAAPVSVCCFVEHGMCPPQKIVVQVIQRVRLDTDQMDVDVLPVLSEATLRPTTESSPAMDVVSVPYPMRISRPPFVKLIFRDRYRAAVLENLSAATRNVAAMVSLVHDIRFPPEDGERTYNPSAVATANKNYSSRFPFLFTAWSAWQFTNKLISLEQPELWEGYEKYLAVIETSMHFLNMAWGLYRGGKAVAAELGLTEDDAKAAAVAQESADETFEIPLTELGQVLERLMNATTGGLGSKRGEPWTLEEMKQQHHFADAQITRYLLQQLHSKLWSGWLKEQFVKLGETLPTGRSVSSKILAAQKKAKESMDSIQKLIDANDEVVVFMDKDKLEARGFIETHIRLNVVEDRNLTTYDVKAGNNDAFYAGWAACGYDFARRSFIDKVEQIEADLDEMPGDPLSKKPLVQMFYTGNVKVDFTNLVFPTTGSVIPSRGEFKKVLVKFKEAVLAGLTTATSRFPSPPPAPPPNPLPLVRWLPCVMQPSAKLSCAARLHQHAEGEFSSQTQLSTQIAQPLMAATLASSAASARCVQTARQFWQFAHVESNRPRLLIRYKDDGDIPNDAAEWKPAENTFRIVSRLVYAPRMPTEATHKMQCFLSQRSPDVMETMQWLERSSLVAHLLDSVPCRTHAEELALGALADRICDAFVARIAEARTTSPKAKHLMDSILQESVADFQRAAALSEHVFHSQGTDSRRLHHNDSFFGCYAGGMTLRAVLAEVPAWRDWQSVSRVPGRTRMDRLFLAAQVVPPQLQMISDTLRAVGSLRPKTAERMPFLCTQSLLPNELFLGEQRGPAVQLEHAFKALCRVEALCQMFEVDGDYRRAVLADCAKARANLEVAQQLSAQGVPAQPQATALFDEPASFPADHRLQEDLEHEDRAVDVGDWELELEMRELALRMDIERHKERVTTDSIDDLKQAIASLNIADQKMYWIPFGAGIASALCPSMGRAFEETPVWLKFLEQDAKEKDDQKEKDGQITYVRVRSWTADNPSPGMHPFQIRIDSDDNIRPYFQVLHVPEPPKMNDLPDPTLHKAWTAAADGDAGASGVAVDCSNDILWNVERVMQCILLHRNKIKDASLLFEAPELPLVPAPDQPSIPPGASEKLYEKAELIAAILYHDLSHDEVGIPPGSTEFAQQKIFTGVAHGPAGFDFVIRGDDASSLDRHEGASVDASTVLLNDSDFDKYGFKDPTRDAYNELAKESLEDLRKRVGAAGGTAQMEELLKNLRAGRRTKDPVRTELEKLVQQNYRAKSYIERVRKERQERLRESFKPIEDNHKSMNKAIERRNEHTRRLWPAIVSIAEKLAGDLLNGLPDAHCEKPSGAEDILEKAYKKNTRKLRVVPLCELCRTLATPL